MGYRDRVDAPGPKRLLALDGGGIRGIISLEVLASIEELLRARTGDGDLVLADYFDYVAGTSTGAVIAAGLSLGMRVDQLQLLYTEHGEEMFDRAFLLKRFTHQYESERLAAMLKRALGEDVTLGDDRLRTLLMLVLRDATTDSPWPLSNAPGARYNSPDHPDNNLLLPLWQLVRASTAAPVYFPPEVVQVGRRTHVFVDGGVTMFNNPAFQLFVMATHPRYGLGWASGESDLLVVSVGTGTAPKANDHLRPGDMNLIYNAASVPAALMSAALHQQDALCRIFGRCRVGSSIDSELGDLIGDAGILEPRMFTYLRYTPELTPRGLAELGLPDVDPEAVQKLDSVDHIAELTAVGRAAAARLVRAEHFEGFMDR